MQLKDGSVLQNGKYRIIRVLGQGGFGITYLAVHTSFDELVAIKESFPKDFCGRDDTNHVTLGTQNNAETVEKLKHRFLKEAQNIAKLDHPGIVKIHDIFEENSTAYYVMDYIEGENLNEMVKHNGPLSETKSVEYIRKVGDALDYIHSHNMTHFDVKPANIVVRRSDDRPILIDFGLSKQYDIYGDATSTLMQGVSQGYSPIELYNAGAISSFSPQTDVYSLGATLYYLLTGETPPMAVSVMEKGVVLPPFISQSIKDAIVEAMQSARSRRPAHVTIFCDRLVANEETSSSNQYHSTANRPTAVELSEEAKSKTNSGNSIADSDKTIAIQPTTIQEPNPQNAPVKSSSRSATWVILAILLGIVIFVWIHSNSDTTDEVSSQSVATDSMTEQVNETQSLTANQQILNSSYVIKDGQSVHFYKGDFYYRNDRYPVMLAFIVTDHHIQKVIYKNVTYGGRIVMSYQIQGNEIRLSGKDGNNDFTMLLSPEDDYRLSGTAVDGNKSMTVRLMSTSESFEISNTSRVAFTSHHPEGMKLMD
ncbi:MAG: serine/threonine protein kinase [Muribaculaceae bacterium]|nr:serine/threonine protein kinase [Muribaculaceae bacterium]